MPEQLELTPVAEDVLSDNDSPLLMWRRNSEDMSTVLIAIPDAGSIVGTLTRDASDRRYLYVDMFGANNPGNGQGKRLLTALRDEGLKHGASVMCGNFTSRPSLGAFAGVVGKKDISFAERFYRKPVDISLEQAMQHPSSYIAYSSIGSDTLVDK